MSPLRTRRRYCLVLGNDIGVYFLHYGTDEHGLYSIRNLGFDSWREARLLVRTRLLAWGSALGEGFDSWL